MDEKTRKKLADPEVAESVRKVAREVDEFIANLKPTEYKDGWSEDNWEEEMKQHPLFTTELEEGKELSPLVEAFQILKYSPECNTPLELAQAHKEDGNEHFKKEKYRLAELSYTEALNYKCEDNNLNSVLYSNRSAARYNMGHYTKALEDASKSIELNPTNVKAYFRSAQCYLKLDKPQECISLCEDGLKLKKKDKALLELKDKALRHIERQRLSEEELKRKKQDLENLNNAIRERGINLIQGGLTLESIECEYLGTVAKVHVTDEGTFMWPVVLFYPQYGTTDFIPAFNENYCIFEYLLDVFMEPPPWDTNLEYSPENIKVYFPDSEGNIVCVNEMESLKLVMKNERFEVTTGGLSFFFTSLQFDPMYRSKNKVIEF